MDHSRVTVANAVYCQGSCHGIQRDHFSPGHTFKKINDTSNNSRWSRSFPHSVKKNPENLYLFIYFVHLIGYWSLSELHMGTAGNTPRWVASLLQGPRSIFWGIGYLAQGYLGSALLPLLLAHIPSFVCNLCLPGLRPRTLHFPAQCPYRLNSCTQYMHTISHNFYRLFFATAGHFYHGAHRYIIWIFCYNLLSTTSS